MNELNSDQEPAFWLHFILFYYFFSDSAELTPISEVLAIAPITELDLLRLNEMGNVVKRNNGKVRMNRCTNI